MKRKLIFLLLVCFFTIFGGGQVYRWTNVCQDSDGWLYEVDHRNIEELPAQRYRLQVRVSRDGRSAVQDWLLDIQTNELSTNGEPPMNIRSGSVASQVILYLKRRRKPDSETALET